MNERQRGFVLLVVLWSVVLLSALMTQVTALARGELQLAANMRSAASLEAAADGLVYDALFRLMSDTPANRGFGTRLTDVADGKGLVRVTSLEGRLNPNTAPEPLLTALLQALGEPEPPAARLAAAIADWRTPGQRPRPLGAKAAQYQAAGQPYGPPGAAFESVQELGDVLGITPALLARMAPHMTVFYQAAPVPADADPVVNRVLESVGVDGDYGSGESASSEGVYARIEADVAHAGSGAFRRRADVWAGHGAQRGRYLVLRWDVPDGE